MSLCGNHQIVLRSCCLFWCKTFCFQVTQPLVSSWHRHSVSCWTKSKNMLTLHYQNFFMNSLYSSVFCDLTTSGCCFVTFVESLTPTSGLFTLSSYLNFFIAYTSFKQWCLYVEDRIWSHCGRPSQPTKFSQEASNLSFKVKSLTSLSVDLFSLFSLMFQFLYPPSYYASPFEFGVDISY